MTQSPLFTLSFWLVLLPVLWVSGSFVGCKLHNKNPLLSGFVKLGLGLGVYSYFLVLAGSLGNLNQSAVLLFLALALTFGWKTGMDVFRWCGEVLRYLGETRGIFSCVCRWTLVATVFFTAMFCFLPEIANDALAIQLHVAKLFVRNASVAPSFYDLLSYRPLLMSVLYATGLLFQNVAISKFFHWFCGILLVSAVAVKVTEVAHSKKLAIFAGLMLWLTPTLMNQITTTYIDAGVSLFIFLGYCVLADGFDDLKPSNFFYAGLLIGLAVAIRSLSLGAVFAVMLMLSLRLLQSGIRIRVTVAGLWFALGVFLTSAYWFLRNWIYTGNPVYPYLGTLFGTEDLTPVSVFYGMGLPRSFLSFLMIPWDLTLKPQYFDYHHWIGPFYLSVLPFAGYAAFKAKAARIHLQFVLFLTVFWYFTAQNVRYLLPAIPVYLLAGSMGLTYAFFGTVNGSKWVRSALRGLAYLMIVFLLALTVRHFRFQFLPVFRVWSKNVYLSKLERTIPIAEWINKRLPRDARILVHGGEYHFFYFDREVIQEEDFNMRTQYGGRSSPEAMAALLKEKGITHILETVDVDDQMFPEDSTKGFRSVNLLLRDRRLSQPLVSLPSANVLDRRCRYILYKLL